MQLERMKPWQIEWILQWTANGKDEEAKLIRMSSMECVDDRGEEIGCS